MQRSVKERILSVIQRRGRGTLFSAQDFLSGFKRWEIDRSHTDLEKQGYLVRILPGLYAFPKYSSLLRQYILPDISEIARAIARKNNLRIFPDGRKSFLRTFVRG